MQGQESAGKISWIESVERVCRLGPELAHSGPFPNQGWHILGSQQRGSQGGPAHAWPHQSWCHGLPPRAFSGGPTPCCMALDSRRSPLKRHTEAMLQARQPREQFPLPRAAGNNRREKPGHSPPPGYFVCFALAAAFPSSKSSKISNKKVQ